MKVTGATSTLFAGGASSGRGAAAHSGCILELHTDTGLTGIAVGDADLRGPIAPLCRDFVIGEDPRAAPAIWQRMQNGLLRSSRRSRSRAAAAILDVALWDLKAKSNGEPLWKTLGGARPDAIACASCTDESLTDTEIGRWFRQMARTYGIRSGMLRAARSRDGNLRRMEKMRAALADGGREPEIGIDAASVWTAGGAGRGTRALEKHFDLAWVAVTAGRREAAGLRKLSDSVRAAVCAGRGLRFPDDFLPHFRRRSIDIVQIDVGINGVSGAMQLADAAFGFELPVMLCAAPGNIQTHLAGAMPYVMNVEIRTARPPTELHPGDVRLEGGRARAGDVPGTGLTPARTRNRNDIAGAR